MSLCGFGLTALRTHRSLVDIKCRHVASSRKVTGWDAFRADSTKTPLCVQSVCVCVCHFWIGRHAVTLSPPHAHTCQRCVSLDQTQFLLQTQRSDVSPNPLRPTLLSFLSLLSCFPSCGSDPTLDHHCGIVYFLRFPS